MSLVLLSSARKDRTWADYGGPCCFSFELVAEHIQQSEKRKNTRKFASSCVHCKLKCVIPRGRTGPKAVLSTSIVHGYRNNTSVFVFLFARLNSILALKCDASRLHKKVIDDKEGHHANLPDMGVLEANPTVSPLVGRSGADRTLANKRIQNT